MATSNHRQLTREELIGALQRMARERRSERITINQFCDSLGIAFRQVYSQFRNWRELREAAGLKTPRAPAPQQFSNAELIREYQRLVHELGRLPTVIEFNRVAKFNYDTLQRRFGGSAGIHRAYRITEEADATRREAANEPPLFHKAEGSYEHPPLDVAYLRNEWAAVRVGFALTSSELRGLESLDFELLVCLDHNWPACPCKVIELQEVWRHPLERDADQTNSAAEANDESSIE